MVRLIAQAFIWVGGSMALLSLLAVALLLLLGRQSTLQLGGEAGRGTTFLAGVVFAVAGVGLGTVTVASARRNRVALVIMFVVSTIAVAVIGLQLLVGRASFETGVLIALGIAMAELLASGYLSWESLGHADIPTRD